MKFLIQRMIVIATVMFSATALAVDPVYTGIFSNQAIKGYDTVAYFTEGQAVKGVKEFRTEYKEATWLFSSQANLDLFLASPEKYAPQYGGYCAYAVSKNATASIQPELFTIHDDKLYLNYNQSINDKWLADKEQLIDLADQNWPSLLDQ